MISHPLLFVLAMLSQAEGPDIFPAETGYRWTYQSKSRPVNVFVRTEKEWTAGPKKFVEVVSAEPKGTDGRTFVFETTAEGAKATRKTWVVSPRGLFPEAEGQANFLIKFPLKSGDRWGNTTVNQGTEEIEVPAGKFTCWKIELKVWLPLGSRSRTAWYAKDVGLVRELSFHEIEGGGSQELLELEKLEKDPAKK